MDKKHIEDKLHIQTWQGPIEEVSDEPDVQKPRLAEVIAKARETFEAKLLTEEFKPTLAEYLKLLQFEREIAQEDEGPKEITVTWVEPESDYSEE